MRFTCDGKTYELEFKREFKYVTKTNSLTGEEFSESSKFPYTTVHLIELGPNKISGKLVREYTVGCWHKEPVFNKEKGRLRALAMLSKGNSLSKEFKEKMWKAYHERAGSTERVTEPKIQD